MSASPARKVAREVVTRVRERSAYAHELMDSALRAASCLPRTRRWPRGSPTARSRPRARWIEAIDRYLGRQAGRAADRGRAARLGVRDPLHAQRDARRGPPRRRAGARSAQAGRRVWPTPCCAGSPRTPPAFPGAIPTTDVAALARLHAHPVWLAEPVDRRAGARGRRAGHGGRQHARAALPRGQPVRRQPSRPRERGCEPTGRCLGPASLPGCIEVGDAGAAVRGQALATRPGRGRRRVRAARRRAGRARDRARHRRGRSRAGHQDAPAAGDRRRARVAPRSSTRSTRTSSRRGCSPSGSRRYGVPGVRILVGDATDFSAIAGRA